MENQSSNGHTGLSREITGTSTPVAIFIGQSGSSGIDNPGKKGSRPRLFEKELSIIPPSNSYSGCAVLDLHGVYIYSVMFDVRVRRNGNAKSGYIFAVH